ncbi:MAG TPA: aminoacyl-tRNA hydrolase [Polyangia bacterium]|jgi:PTH1 family peptidyl-tRNA hydrolase
MWLVVGLGNPGPRYAGNRHNVGFMVADLLADRWRAGGWRQKFGAELTQAGAFGDKIVLFKPQSFMNVSGGPVARAVQFFQVEPGSLVVVHDDLDLDFDRMKVKVGGGHGGHNGLRSIIADLGTPEFVRVRVGIGRPPPRMDPADYVLQDFSKAERTALDLVVGSAADAAESILRDGVISAMNRYNQKLEA